MTEGMTVAEVTDQTGISPREPEAPLRQCLLSVSGSHAGAGAGTGVTRAIPDGKGDSERLRGPAGHAASSSPSPFALRRRGNCV